jgi:hypothetical protein
MDMFHGSMENPEEHFAPNDLQELEDELQRDLALDAVNLSFGFLG